MNPIRFAAFLTIALTMSVTAYGGPIPYPNPGTIAPQMLLTASATGNVTGYFIQGGAASGGGAVDVDTIFLFDVTTGTRTGPFFNNQTTAAGTSADFGHVNAGDVLVFELLDATFANMVAATDALYSTDGVNHGYETSFAGGRQNGANFPAGTYVGIEDRPNGSSDFNYQDDTFIFTNVGAAATTPEPNTLFLIGTGVLGLAGAVRRKIVR